MQDGPVATPGRLAFPGFYFGFRVQPSMQGTITPSRMPWIFFLSPGTMVARQPPSEVSPLASMK